MTTLAPVTVSFERILVPTDFSDASQRALDYAKWIAKECQSHLFLAHVNQMMNPITPPEAAWIDSESMQEKLEEQMEQAAAGLRSEGFKADGISTMGRVRDQLYSIIKESRIDLVVMGTHGRSGWERFLFGSDTESLLRHVHCPVMVVGPATRPAGAAVWHPRRVICATSLNPDSAWIAAYAYRLARQHGAAFTVFNVEEVTGKQTAADRDAFEAAFKESLPEDAGLPESLHTFVTDGKPGEQIADYAKEIGADLIVMGALAAADIATHLNRGTAPKVFAGTPCPVLTLRHQ